MLRNMTTIYITHNESLLLLYRIGSRVVAPSWCGIGGHFEKDELNNPTACLMRELSEETEITENDIENMKLKYVTLRMKNNEIRQNYYYFADLKNTKISIDECSEGILEWVPLKDVLSREMPFTAKECLRHYLEYGRYDDKFYAGIASRKEVIFKELDEF